MRYNYSAKYTAPVTQAVFAVLAQADGTRPLHTLFAQAEVQEEQARAALPQILDRWSRRLVVMQPQAVDA